MLFSYNTADTRDINGVAKISLKRVNELTFDEPRLSAVT